MAQRVRLNPLRAVLLVTLLLSALALYRFTRPLNASGQLQSFKWQAAVALGAVPVILTLGLLILAWSPLQERVLSWLDRGFSKLRKLGWWNLALFALVLVGLALLAYGRYGRYLSNIYPRLLLFWLAALAGSVFIRASGFERSFAELLSSSMLLTGAGMRMGTYLADVSTYPFTLGWSEASRFYYASLYFSQRIYGAAAEPTVLHPSRYLLQAVPFLIPDSPLWLHRLWQMFLWIGVTGLCAWMLARRLSIPDSLSRWDFAGWTFMFLILGPVYYHLQVPVILVLWLYNRQRSWQSLGAILLASAWAGISRVNWFPVPAMLAAMLYFMEEPVESRSIWRYLVPPFLWGILGVAVAFGAQALYALLSGNPTEQFTSSFSSDLLWYRLLPNPTYEQGILPAILLVSLPLFLVILIWLFPRRRAIHPIRLTGTGAILLILFAGGLVVSTKIGGGSNLHNMDAYLVLLMVAAAYAFFDRVGLDSPERATIQQSKSPVERAIHQGVLLLALFIPLYITVDAGGGMDIYNPQQTQEALATIREYATETAGRGEEVLFITERQLLTFHEIEGVPLVDDYEKVFLMEMAMAGNPNYLGKFHDELKNHRFGLIISEPLFTKEKGREEVFGEENDAWVNQVSKPVLCYYRPRKNLLNDVPIQILVPRDGETNCSLK
jgi:hypothetical protein